MRKSTVIALIIVVLAVAGGLGAYFATRSSSDNKTPATSNMPNMNMSTKNNNTNSAPVATNAVTIQNFAFSPRDITVKKGTTVTWTNKDSTTHTVTEAEADGLTGPNSGNLAPGQSYSFTFDTVATYHYHCTIHPEMLGTVKVIE